MKKNKIYTVKELINELKNFPPDATVVYRDYEGDGFGGAPVFCSHEISDIGYIEHANEVGLYIKGL